MWLWIAAIAGATTYDVYPTDDLWGAVAGAVAGDEVIVHAGTYTSQQGSGSWFREVTLVGTAASPIVVRSATGDLVVIEGDPGASQNVINLGGSYFTFQGFEIVYGSHGVRLQQVDHATIEDLHIHDTADVGLSANIGGNTYDTLTIRGNHIHHTNGTGECMYLGCNDDGCVMQTSIIEYNWCHDTMAASQGDGIELKTGSWGNIIRHNVIHDVRYPGITMYGARGRGDNEVYGNLIWNAGDNGIQLVAETVVHNNVVFDSGVNGIHVKSSQGQDPADLDIRHNTVFVAGSACFKGNDLDSATNVVVANNAFLCDGATGVNVASGPGATVMASNVVAGSSNLGAPLAGNGAADLLDVVGHDAYPADPSALRDVGDPAQGLTEDFDCEPRVDGSPDAGAYEWVGAAHPGWIPTAGFKPACAAGTTPSLPTGDTAAPGGGDADTDADTDTDADADGDVDSDVDTLPTDGGDPADDEGGCTCNGSGVPLGWIALLPLIVAVRRQGQ